MSEIYNNTKDEYQEVDQQQPISQINNNQESKEEINWNDFKKGQVVDVDITSQVSELDNSINFTVSKAADIACKHHGKNYIGVDTNKFILVCKQCQLEGKRGSFLDYNGINQEKENNEEEDYFCNSHPESKGVFYCEDCKYFICKLCFANAHRNHNSNIPSVMANEFKEKINEAINDIRKVQPIISEALNGIDSIYQQLKRMREDSIKRIKDMVKTVSNTHKIKLEKLEQNFKAIFGGVDSDTQDAFNRLGIVLKKINKYIAELDEIETQLVRQQNPTGLCQYKKSKANLFKDINTLVADSRRMIEFKVEIIKTQSAQKLDSYKKSIESLVKQITLFEKSILSSITSGVTSSNFVLRRFTKFSNSGLKYFKMSNVILNSNTGIFLSGLSLCGLYLSSTKSKTGEAKIEPIPITITISEIKETGDVVKLKENHKMKHILNRYDPLFLVYFKKGVYLKANQNFLITIQNNDKNCYLDMWCGEVSKKYLQPVKPKIVCNCTNIQFDFNQAEGYESDFNEFNSGVIGGLIYSYVKSD